MGIPFWAIPALIKGGESIFNLITNKKIPTYTPQEYSTELPEDISSLLSTISSGEQSALSQQFRNISRGSGEKLASMGVEGVGARQAVGREINAQRGEALQGLLSNQAKRVLAMLDVYNQWKSGQYGMKYQSDVLQTQNQNQFWNNLIGGLGSAAATGYTMYQTQSEQQKIMEMLKKILGRDGNFDTLNTFNDESLYSF